jgi:hypothetical protein
VPASRKLPAKALFGVFHPLSRLLAGISIFRVDPWQREPGAKIQVPRASAKQKAQLVPK